MVPGEQASAAVAAATGLPVSELWLTEDGSVAAAAQRAWTVRSCAFAGLGENSCPDVLIVSPLRTDDPDASVWVADLPGRGFVRLEDDEALAALFAACPDLSPETIARLVAINRGPRGAERALFEDEEVDLLLAELAPAVPPSQRGLKYRRDLSGSWEMDFLGALLRRPPDDLTFRLTVARWSVRFDPPATLRWDRREVLTDALLERYRV